MLGWAAEAEEAGGTAEGSPGCEGQREADDGFSVAEADVRGGISGFKAMVQVECGGENVEASQP